jgi:hypothetical protein
MKLKCDGDGMCLEQDTINTYKKNNKYNCKYNCKPEKCPNFELCGTKYPEVDFDCHGGLCGSCNMTFGKWQGGKGDLIFKSNTKCVWCDNITRCISFPKCDHYACIRCFKRVYGFFSINSPDFPYPKLENEYFEGDDNVQNKFQKKYPEIKIWEDICCEIADLEEYIQDKFSKYKKCPKCDKN